MKVFAILAAAVALVQISLATGFPGASSGEKTFKLNDEVAEPLLKFNSTAPLEDIEGTVDQNADPESTVKFDPSDIEATTGSVKFKVADIKTGIDLRDEHLQGSDWLDAENHPYISFALTKVKNVEIIESKSGRSVAKGIAVGEYSMHGHTNRIEAPIKITHLEESSATQKRAPGDLFYVEGQFEVALADFKVKGKKGVVGEKVGEVIQVEFKLYYNSK